MAVENPFYVLIASEGESCSLPGLYTLAYTKVRGYDVEVERKRGDPRDVPVRELNTRKRGPERRLAAVIDAASM